jgi:hypothetical protein
MTDRPCQKSELADDDGYRTTSKPSFSGED